MMLYSGEEVEDKAEDEKFDKLMSNFDRIQKQLSQQQQALSHLVKRVNNLIERREKKEKAIKAKREGLPMEEEENMLMPGHSKNTFNKSGAKIKNSDGFGSRYSGKNIKPSNLKSKAAKKEESDEEMSKDKLHQLREKERQEIEDRYKNENEEMETENIKNLTRIAGKYKKDAKFDKFKSKALPDF